MRQLSDNRIVLKKSLRRRHVADNASTEARCPPATSSGITVAFGNLTPGASTLFQAMLRVLRDKEACQHKCAGSPGTGTATKPEKRHRSQRLLRTLPRPPGHEEQSRTSAALAKAVKGALCLPGKAPEILTAKQQETLELIESREPRLFKTYQVTEELRPILHLPSCTDAAAELRMRYFRAAHSRLEPVRRLACKVRRHEQGIINALKYRYSNARIEAMNSRIKLTIRRANEFRNIDGSSEQIAVSGEQSAQISLNTTN